MGIVERIRQIQTEQARKDAEAEAARKLAIQSAEEERILREKPRKDFVKAQLDKINQGTGILTMIDDLDREYWKKNKKVAHGIIRSTDPNDVLSLVLVWRNNRHERYKKPEELIAEVGYKRVSIIINPDSGSITIGGDIVTTISREQWSQDKKIVENALVDIFLNKPYYNGGGTSVTSGWF